MYARTRVIRFAAPKERVSIGFLLPKNRMPDKAPSIASAWNKACFGSSSSSIIRVTETVTMMMAIPKWTRALVVDRDTRVLVFQVSSIGI